MTFPRLLLLTATLLVLRSLCVAQRDATPENATSAVLHAFETHDIVMFGEIHGNKQEYEWLRSLVATPEFADRVDDIVLETGNSLYQQFVDLYVAGENVRFEQVQNAWRNTVGLIGPPSPLVESLYGAVRETNLQRRGKHQMRIVCGDPAFDWDIVNDINTVDQYISRRDEWYAHVVQKQVLAKHHRALLVMGAGHFVRNSPKHSAKPSIETALRKTGARTYVILSGTNTPNDCCDVDHRFDSWPALSIASARGWVGELSARSLLEGGYPQSKPKLKDGADAFLYLGPRNSLTSVSMTRTQLQGTAYGKEIERRLKIRMILQPDEAPLFPENEEQPQFPRP